MDAEGEGGALRVGWQQAAHIGRWSLRAAADHGWLVTVALQRVDQFWITQRPLTLTLHIGGLAWTWTDVEFDADGRIHVQSPPVEGVQALERQLVRHP